MTDERSFEAFFHLHRDRRVRQVSKKIGDFHQAEDIVSEAFSELALKWDDAENPEALLTTIIKRKVSRYRTRRASDVEVITYSLLEDIDLPRNQLQMLDPVITAERRDAIRRVAAHMRPIERQLALARAQQYTTREIADNVGTTSSNVLAIERRMHQRLTGPSEEAAELSIASLNSRVRLLPRRQSEVMEHTLNGMRPEQIASMIGITPNDARVNLWHARKALREMLLDGDQLDELISRRQAMEPWEFTERIIKSTQIFGSELPLAEHSRIDWSSLEQVVAPAQTGLDRLTAAAHPNFAILRERQIQLGSDIRTLESDRYSWKSVDDVVARVQDLINMGDARGLLSYLLSNPPLEKEPWVCLGEGTFECEPGVAIADVDRYLATCRDEARHVVEADRRMVEQKVAFPF